MKKTSLYIAVLATTLLGQTACSDWLEEVPLTTITESNFYNTNQDLLEAGGGLHAGFSNMLQNNYHTIGDLATDQITTGPASDALHIGFDLYTFDRSEGSIVRGYWQGSYKIINNANLLIKKTPEASVATTAAKKRALGEAHFFKAYAYYTLARLYKDAPIIETVPAELFPVRSPQAELYKLVVDNLKLAVGEADPAVGLPATVPTAENGRVVVGAALGLLAEVYLTLKDYSNAALYAQKVIDANRYALWPNWGDQYLFVNKYKANSAPLGESILAGQYHQDVGVPNRISRDCTPATVLLGPGQTRTGLDHFVTRKSVYDSFEPGDARKAYIFPATYPDVNNVQRPWNPPTATIFYAYKYRLDGQPGTPVFGNTAHNNDVLRYADILLIKAEALNETTGPTPEAYAAINQVRTRAKLPALAGLDKEGFRNAVEKERIAEFLLEGHRFWDLKRTGKWFSVMKTIIPTLDPQKEYFPVPQSEIDLNKNLTQNPGW